MKKTMTMIVFILALGSQAIANGLSELKIRTNTNVPLKVIIDGQVVAHNTTNVVIGAVPFGKHSLQVFQVLKSYHSYNEEPLFFGEIYLPQNTVTHALVKHHQFLIEEQFALQPKPIQYVKPGNSGYGNYYHTKPVQWNTKPQNHKKPNNRKPQNMHQGQNQGHAYVPPVIEVFPMNNQDFGNLQHAIENQWFSDGKRTVLKQAIADGHYFTTNQVKSLINLFDFSGDRLAVAKMAYTSTLDSENYFLVYESLEWDSSVQNLSNYIASL